MRFALNAELLAKYHGNLLPTARPCVGTAGRESGKPGKANWPVPAPNRAAR